MTETNRQPDLMVVGAGPAGLAAAIEARRAGLVVTMLEQRQTIGGAIYRQPIAGVTPVRQSAAARARWTRLAGAFAAQSIDILHGAVFLGIDGDGKVVIEDRKTRTIRHEAPKAVILALGAVEKVLPRPGWHMAGVMTAGGLQVMMKETGRVPSGRILLAGSGPLLVAVAAQMARLGNPPVAIVESGDPMRRFAPALALASHPSFIIEAFGYLSTVISRGIPWLRGTTLIRIDRQDDQLTAHVRDRRGRVKTIPADMIGLHDGIRQNDFGLPSDSLDAAPGPIVIRAGDCREALGAPAAEEDGRRAAQKVIRLLSGKVTTAEIQLARFRSAQQTLNHLFAPVDKASPMAALPDETVVCRCENRTVGDLKRLCLADDVLTGREVKHNGRFAMGACQGRFCAANTAALMAAFNSDRPKPEITDLTGQRWPLRPVSIAALTRALPEAPSPIQPDNMKDEA